MSVTGVDSTVHPAPAQRRSDAKDAFVRFKPGQRVDVFVQERLGERSYLMRFAGTQHIVEAAMSLTAGTTFAATVVAVGDKLELKWVAPQSAGIVRDAAVQGRQDDPQDPNEALLDTTAEQFAVTLSDSDHAVVAAAMRDVAHPLDMARSALFLSKTDRAIESGALQAVYSALAWLAEGGLPGAATPATLATAAEGGSNVQSLALGLQQQFSAAAPQPTLQQLDMSSESDGDRD
jgi:hypothetical protein